MAISYTLNPGPPATITLTGTKFCDTSSFKLEVSINGAKGVLFAISGGDDITIHEIQEAAKIITESIDKDAKVIFGTIHDEKLKKGELKVTVIATNFANDLPRKNLFSGTNVLNQTLLKEESPEKVTKEIHSTIQQNSNKNLNNDFLKKVEKKPDTIEEIIIDDEAEDWSAVPAFLRRKK